MAKTVKQFRLFVASPSDIEEEKEIISQIVNEWNLQVGQKRNIHIETVDWYKNSYPDVGNRPQELINQQVLDESDIVVGVFWTKFGSPTGVARSGTEEELKRSIEQGKKVMIYFSDMPISLSKVDNDEYQKIIKFKEEFKDEGLYFEFDKSSEFRDLFRKHLSSVMSDLLSQDNNKLGKEEIEISLSEEYWTIILASIDNTITTTAPIIKKLRKEKKSEKDLSDEEITALAGPLIIKGKIIDELNKVGIITDEGAEAIGFDSLMKRIKNN